ncbi:MAG: acyl-ACP--UDP-N-acetylglucosamine O-acyltransferase [Vampirovibrio sp.]|nr:acyl-ACP--UDP-N-acetylglucosamine O-acyltransferase [Vampirovibrio sp.]
MSIHPTAVIDPTAEVGTNVVIGPYAIVGPHCVIGDHTELDSHAVIKEYTRLGKGCKVASGAVIGGTPQDFKFGHEASYVTVGDNSIIRECVTINRATGEGNETKIGSGCMIMAYSHIAHNCTLGDDVILANAVQLGGHVEVGDAAFISGTCSVHQFVRIGKLAMVAGFSGTRQDIPPFAMTDGRPQAVIVGLNRVGLKRRGYGLDTRNRLKKAYQLLWFSGMNQSQAIETIRTEIDPDPAVEELVTFVETSKRGIHKPLDEETRSPDSSSTDSKDNESVLPEFV